MGKEQPQYCFRAPLCLHMQVQAVARGNQTRNQMAANRNLSDQTKEMLARSQSKEADKRHFLKEMHEVLGVSKDDYNASPALQQAHTWMEQNQIPRLLESLMSRAIVERSQDLRTFLRNTLIEMKEKRGKPSMGMFTDQDLETMFSMWDVEQRGVIPLEKVVETLNALQCGRNAEKAVDGYTAEIDKAIFMKIVKKELETLFSA